MGELETNPISPGEGAERGLPQERGILTLAELAALFNPESFDKVWHGELRHFAFELLAAARGAASGNARHSRVERTSLRRRLHRRGALLGRQATGLSDSRSGGAADLSRSLGRRAAAAIESTSRAESVGPSLFPSDVVFWGAGAENTPLTKTGNVSSSSKPPSSRIEITEEGEGAGAVLSVSQLPPRVQHDGPRQRFRTSSSEGSPGTARLP